MNGGPGIGMLTEKRQEEIVRLVQDRESVTVAELKEILQASESTIRRDIVSLDKEGRLTKVFGGAVALRTAKIVNKELSVVQKKELQATEKQAIARYAASLIAPDDCVYLDAGTTTGWMIEYISEPQATYVTNAVDHAKRLAQKGFHVILIGGELKGTTEAVAGAEAVLNIQKYHFSKGFFGTNGMEQKMGFTTPDINEALVKQSAIKNTQPNQRYILATGQKFGKICAVTFSGFEGTVILTDEVPQEAYWKNVTIKCVNDEGCVRNEE